MAAGCDMVGGMKALSWTARCGLWGIAFMVLPCAVAGAAEVGEEMIHRFEDGASPVTWLVVGPFPN